MLIPHNCRSKSNLRLLRTRTGVEKERLGIYIGLLLMKKIQPTPAPAPDGCSILQGCRGEK